MRYTRLGRRGPRVSVVGLGFWQAGSRLWGWRRSLESEVLEGVRLAVEAGVNLFDTAEVYGNGVSERLLAKALRGLGEGDVVVASKLAGYRWTRGSLVRGLEGVNRRLGRTVDLIQHHWPPPVYVDPCRVARGLEELVKGGYAHYYGLSNYPARLVSRVLECVKSVEPVSNQVLYNLVYRVPEARLKPLMMKHGMTLIAWSPLARGALAGLTKPVTMAQRMDRTFKSASRDTGLRRALEAVAARRGASPAQVALAWLIAKGAVPIPGFRRADRVREYINAAKLSLSGDDVGLLDRASEKYYRDGDYDVMQGIRLIPGFIQMAVIKLMGGV